MNLTHLQLNTAALKFPDKVMSFIIDNKVNIACLQEIVYPTNKLNRLFNLCKTNNFNYFEGIHFYYSNKGLTVASSIVSKFPIEDFTTLYFNAPSYEPKNISEGDFVGKELLEDDQMQEPMASRGLKHSIKSRAIPVVTLKINDQKLRVYSLNFTVSSWATETEQMYKMSQLITSNIKYSKSLAIIASGDLNIQADSYSVKLLKKRLNHHTGDLKNTLSLSHRALEKDFPKGLAVDHVFSSGLKHLSTEAVQIDFSDHKAILSTFKLEDKVKPVEVE